MANGDGMRDHDHDLRVGREAECPRKIARTQVTGFSMVSGALGKTANILMRHGI